MLVIIVITSTVIITLALVAWFLFTPKHPETAASHVDEYPDTPSNRFYGPVPPGPSGPAGPDAEL